jgi:hypothetical protein
MKQRHGAWGSLPFGPRVCTRALATAKERWGGRAVGRRVGGATPVQEPVPPKTTGIVRAKT